MFFPVESIIPCWIRDSLLNLGFHVESAISCGISDSLWNQRFPVESVIPCGISDSLWNQWFPYLVQHSNQTLLACLNDMILYKLNACWIIIIYLVCQHFWSSYPPGWSSSTWILLRGIVKYFWFEMCIFSKTKKKLFRSLTLWGLIGKKMVWLNNFEIGKDFVENLLWQLWIPIKCSDFIIQVSSVDNPIFGPFIDALPLINGTEIDIPDGELLPAGVAGNKTSVGNMALDFLLPKNKNGDFYFYKVFITAYLYSHVSIVYDENRLLRDEWVSRWYKCNAR